MTSEEISIERALVEVEFSLVKSEEGGRLSPARSGYRPNHHFPGAPTTFMGEIEFEPKELLLMPGERTKATVWAIYPSDMRKLFVPGKSWDVKEGARMVGKIVIKDVVFEKTTG